MSNTVVKQLDEDLIELKKQIIDGHIVTGTSSISDAINEINRLQAILDLNSISKLQGKLKVDISSDIITEDETFGPVMGCVHRNAFQRITTENKKKKRTKDQEIELPIRIGTEIEFYPNGNMKQYKY